MDKLNVRELTGREVIKAFDDAKESISVGTTVVNAIKGHYKPLVEKNSGRLVLDVDATGESHGFQLDDSSPRLSVKELEKALAKRGLSADEIAAIVTEAKGDPSKTFKSF